MKFTYQVVEDNNYMDSIDRLKQEYDSVGEELKTEFQKIDSTLSPGEILRRKSEIRSLPQFQLLSTKISSLKEKDWDDLRWWLKGLHIPDSLVKFFSWSGFLRFGETLNAQGFLATSMQLSIDRNVHLHNLEILYENRKPLEFRRLLIVGNYSGHDIGVWLSSETGKEFEVVLFEKRRLNSKFTKDKFSVIATDFKKFIDRLVFCFTSNIAMNLLSPCNLEKDWLIKNESHFFLEVIEPSFKFSFDNPSQFLSHWRVGDLEQEARLVLELQREKFRTSSINYENFQKQMNSYKKKYGLL